MSASSALAETPDPHWTISAYAAPTDFVAERIRVLSMPHRRVVMCSLPPVPNLFHRIRMI